MGKGPLKFRLDKQSGFARAITITLPHGDIITPVYMPVGTQGTLKAITTSQIKNMNPKIMLSNTFFLNLRPGTETLDLYGGLHNFSGIRTNLLTDSGGFQMVSLLDLTQITEEGVQFSSPVDATQVLLTPEESIRTQQSIGSDVMMVLDDVVSAELNPERDRNRIAEATARTTRWLDRCIAAHTSNNQTLFAIVQGHLDCSSGGFRDQSLRDIAARQDFLGGIAIGGLSGGESKDQFWRVVRHCSEFLDREAPQKPRYLMGVGYPVDLITCAMLGVDMFDCVYATRTGRFGTAFTKDGEANLTRETFSKQDRPIMEGCRCEACSRNVSRAYLNCLLKEDESVAGSLISIHNVCFLLDIMLELRQNILAGTEKEFVKQFILRWTSGNVDLWVKDALGSCGVFFDTK